MIADSQRWTHPILSLVLGDCRNKHFSELIELKKHVDIRENQLKKKKKMVTFLKASLHIYRYGKNQFFSRFIPSVILTFMYVTFSDKISHKIRQNQQIDRPNI